MHGFCPSWQLLLVLDPVRGISIAPTIDRPPQRLIYRLDLVANRVTWSGFLLVSAWLFPPPLRPPRGAPRGRGAERKRSGSWRGAAHCTRCCVPRKPPLGRARRLVGRVSRRWPPCSKARWQRPHKTRPPLAAMLESALAAMLEGSLAAPPKARWRARRLVGSPAQSPLAAARQGARGPRPMARHSATPRPATRKPR